jgi:DNA mismatch repair protein MutL
MTNPIIELSDNIIKKIAAGEVVNRPVNIIKELIENSIDANADKIEILFENGGIDRIEVSDNGDGIPSDQLALAFKLHTTSKITSDDIERVTTLGFRGEALSSIAAVSRVQCISKQMGEQAKKVVIEGSKLVKEEYVNSVDGTIIEVIGLFYNVPARKKFLKSPNQEKKIILDTLTHIMLIFHNIHIKVSEIKQGKSKLIMESPHRKEMLSAIFDVLGAEIASELIHVSGNAGRWKVHGYISKPNLSRKDRNFQFIRVNGRIIKNLDLQKSVELAYGSQLLSSNYPVLILDFSGNSDWIDFNVHPQKREIRFSTEDTIFQDLTVLIRDSLDTSADLLSIPQKKKLKSKNGGTTNIKNISYSSSDNYEDIKPEDISFDFEIVNESLNPIDTDSYTQYSLQEFLEGASKKAQPSSVHVKGTYRVIGHIMKKFALIDTGNELWIMDVHAADERVKFEMYEQHTKQYVATQQLLEPYNVEVREDILDVVLEYSEELKRFGMEISKAGETKLFIHSIPAYFDQIVDSNHIENMFNDIVSTINSEERINTLDTPLSKMEYYIASRLACHGSVRSGYLVNLSKIGEILENLMKCKNPWTCAHGRPTILKFPKSILETWFRRSG